MQKICNVRKNKEPRQSIMRENQPTSKITIEFVLWLSPTSGMGPGLKWDSVREN